MEKEKENSVNAKSEPNPSLDLVKYKKLTKEMRETIDNYILSLHGISDDSKLAYKTPLNMLGRFLVNRKVRKFEDAKAKDIDLFLSKYDKDNTKNYYIIRLKHFYGEFLKLPEVVNHLKLSNQNLEPVTPSELLTPDEVVKLANEASKRREMYKVVILVLFESCARISEVLSLRLGDVIFGSVTDKEGHRKLIATLYFKRSKGKVNK